VGFFGGGRGGGDGSERGDLGPPPDPFRIPQQRYGSPGGRRTLGFIAATMVFFFVADAAKSIYVDLLWFDSVAFGSVFRTAVGWRVALFLLGALIAAVVLGVNVALARRLAPRAPEESFIEEIDPQAIRRVLTVLLIAGTAFVSLIFGGSLGGAWETILGWRNAVPFGLRDPQFDRDVSFYLFSLPAYHLLQGWLLGLLIVSTLAAGAVYGLAYSLQRFVLNVTPGMRIHLSMLVGLILLTIGVGIWLSVFDLASSEGGIVAGATYTDVNARIPVRYLLALLSVLSGAAVITSAFLQSSYRVPAFVLGLWGFAGIVGGLLYPAGVQALQVEPNELQTETQFIERNIRMTRTAYGVDDVVETNFPARPALTASQLEANPVTVDNIRLWDPVPLRDTFNQIQSIRPFYTFSDVDVDRYIFGGRSQQTMLAVRELDVARAGAANWTRQRLQLTHGFGAVATVVNDARDEGLPVLLLADIPPTGTAIPLNEAGARVYFGERTDHYVIVRTNVAEFDYPVGEGGKETRYEPERGIQLSSAIRRLALAWELGDTNLLISNQIGADSRVLMHRALTARIQKVAPFLTLDPDPYAVVIDGRIVWVQDAYTTSDRFPYSQHRSGVNYIRNSVKIVVDSITGDMTFYLMEPDDPIVATWAGIFPSLFTPAAEMPPAIRQHLRYPEGMFKLQAEIYQRYHITDANAFFVGEDVWNIPLHQAEQQQRPLDPYYLTMKLPGEQAEEFVLVMPFTPRNKQNTVAWLAGRSDGAQYGALRAYRFPTDTLVFGPAQIESRIDQHPGISQQMSLWNQSGSHVIRGNLLMIPIDDSFLFVEPLYLQAENSPLPELKRVIVANGNAIAMEASFRDSLDVVLGRKASTLPGGASGGGQGVTQPVPTPPGPTATGTPRATGTPGAQDLRALIDAARQASGNAQSELDRLRTLLDQIESQSGR
jgi:uncharacterized protein